ncbi:MAG TPA: ankyrin repeat domain-containing protein [Thermoanaerobaculia bacterium]|nr:ankyrin repeat domain-containing protein [Thermoanaerobaculia bacterium]
MKKGCIAGLLAWVVCAGAYGYFLHPRFGSPYNVIVPVVAGFFMAVVVGNLRIALDRGVQSVRAGHMPVLVPGERPPDGKTIVVTGHIRAVGPTLRSPLNGLPAVIYEYDINHAYTDSRGYHPVKDYVGYALTSAVIDSVQGPIKLLGFPELSGFGVDGNLEAAKPYVANTQFEDISGFDIGGMYRFVKDRITNDAGEIRKDFRLSSDPRLDEKASMTESVVAPGEQVTAMGRYSAEKGGLVKSADAQLSLARGSGEVSAAMLRQKAGQALVASIVFAAIVNGALLLVLTAAHGKKIEPRKSADQVRRDVNSMQNAAASGNTTKVEAAIAGGMDVDARDEEGSTALMRTGDPDTAAALIAHGADVNATNHNGETPLIAQAEAGNAAIVNQLIKAGAKLEAREPKSHSTALKLALDYERLDVVQALRDAGAYDETVTGKNGRAANDRSDSVRALMKFLDAMQQGDIAAVRAAATFEFNDADFKQWQQNYPMGAKIVSAFENDQAATIVARGPRADGTYMTRTFQLARGAGGWKVTDDRWESRLDSRQP